MDFYTRATSAVLDRIGNDLGRVGELSDAELVAVHSAAIARAMNITSLLTRLCDCDQAAVNTAIEAAKAVPADEIIRRSRAATSRVLSDRTPTVAQTASMLVFEFTVRLALEDDMARREALRSGSVQ